MVINRKRTYTRAWHLCRFLIARPGEEGMFSLSHPPDADAAVAGAGHQVGDSSILDYSHAVYS